MLAALVTVVLAAVTAISVIAYRHPKGYAKIYRVICEALLWAFFAIAGFGVAVSWRTQNAHSLHSNQGKGRWRQMK